MHGGQHVGEKSVKIQTELAAEITIPVTLPVESRARAGRVARRCPASRSASAVRRSRRVLVLYLTSEVDDGSKPRYRDTKPLGIGVAAGGAVLVGIGFIGWTHEF